MSGSKHIDANELINLRENGMSISQIAKHFGCSKANITQRLRKLLPPKLPESMKELTEKEQKFVLSMAEGKTQTQSALASFECGSMESAKTIGWELANRDDIRTAISEIMEMEGIGRRHRIRALKRHIDNERDAQASLKGIDIANKMEGIYIEKAVVASVNYGDLVKSDQAIEAEIKELEAELLKPVFGCEAEEN